MSRLVLLGLLPFAFAPGALAQTADPHVGHTTSAGAPRADADPHAGHNMAPPEDPHASHAMPAPAPSASDPHSGHRMGPSADPHTGHAVTRAGSPPAETSSPPTPSDHAADRIYGSQDMDLARDTLRAEHGGARQARIMLDVLELRPDGGSEGYAWAGEFRYGDDLNRLVIKTSGEGDIGGDLETDEAQALYSRAIGPYFDFQAGIRQGFQRRPRRTYATVGFEGLAPYWFEVEGALFVSNKGDVSGRLEGSYDLRLTQRLILEPRAEFNFAAQDVPELGLGSGVTDAELGLRVRYEIRREFAPYVGVAYERRYGRTADLAHAAGEDIDSVSLVLGIRAWF